MLDGGAVRADEGEVFTAFGEGEVGVEGGCRVPEVEVGCPDDAEFAGGEGDGGEAPFGEVGGVVGEGPIGEVDGLGGRVVDFDPVGEVAEVVGDGGRVIGHELADHGLCGSFGGEEQDQQQG